MPGPQHGGQQQNQKKQGLEGCGAGAALKILFFKKNNWIRKKKIKYFWLVITLLLTMVIRKV